MSYTLVVSIGWFTMHDLWVVEEDKIQSTVNFKSGSISQDVKDFLEQTEMTLIEDVSLKVNKEFITKVELDRYLLDASQKCGWKINFWDIGYSSKTWIDKRMIGQRGNDSEGYFNFSNVRSNDFFSCLYDAFQKNRNAFTEEEYRQLGFDGLKQVLSL